MLPVMAQSVAKFFQVRYGYFGIILHLISFKIEIFELEFLFRYMVYFTENSEANTDSVFPMADSESQSRM